MRYLCRSMGIYPPHLTLRVPSHDGGRAKPTGVAERENRASPVHPRNDPPQTVRLRSPLLPCTYMRRQYVLRLPLMPTATKRNKLIRPTKNLMVAEEGGATDQQHSRPPPIIRKTHTYYYQTTRTVVCRRKIGCVFIWSLV